MADGPSNFDRMNQGQLGGGSSGGGPTMAPDGNPVVGGSAVGIAFKGIFGGTLPDETKGLAAHVDTTGIVPLNAPPGTAIGGQQPGKIAKGMEKMSEDLSKMNTENWPKFQVTDMGIDHHPTPIESGGGFATATVSSRKGNGGFEGPG